jgi:hypothetical protein
VGADGDDKATASFPCRYKLGDEIRARWKDPLLEDVADLRSTRSQGRSPTLSMISRPDAMVVRAGMRIRPP